MRNPIVKTKKIKKESGFHDGHRDRFRKRLACDPHMSGFGEHEILEWILYPVTPRKDTNLLAHKLIRHFGSLHAVFEASPAELKSFKGITKNAALFISTYMSVARKVEVSKAQEHAVLSTPHETFKVLSNYLYGDTSERVLLALVNSHSKFLDVIDISHENYGCEAKINRNKLVHILAHREPYGAIIVHNHPSGEVTPSQEDIETTAKLMAMFSVFKVKYLDHMIISPDDKYFSFTNNMIIQTIKDMSSDIFPSESIMQYPKTRSSGEDKGLLLNSAQIDAYQGHVKNLFNQRNLLQRAEYVKDVCKRSVYNSDDDIFDL